jgi:hypothetical protein
MRNEREMRREIREKKEKIIPEWYDFLEILQREIFTWIIDD